MAHGADFGRESGNNELARQVMLDYREAELEAVDRVLCDYAVKLTLQPAAIGDGDIESLREAGFSDRQVLVATQVISYFNCINRMVDALGADAEDYFVMSEQEWLEERKPSSSA